MLSCCFFINLFGLLRNYIIGSSSKIVTQPRNGGCKFWLLPWFNPEFGLIVVIDKNQGAFLFPPTLWFFLGFFQPVENEPVHSSRHKVKPRQFGKDLMLSDLVATSKRVLPGGKARKNLPLGFRNSCTKSLHLSWFEMCSIISRIIIRSNIFSFRSTL